jgi:hypothetical protein
MITFDFNQSHKPCPEPRIVTIRSLEDLCAKLQSMKEVNRLTKVDTIMAEREWHEFLHFQNDKGDFWWITDIDGRIEEPVTLDTLLVGYKVTGSDWESSDWCKFHLSDLSDNKGKLVQEKYYKEPVLNSISEVLQPCPRRNLILRLIGRLES